VLAMVSSAIGEVGRAGAVTPVAFLAWTVPIMAGAGIGNVICPPTIKKYFPDKIGLVMGVYVGAVQLSSAIPPLFVTQMQSAFGWRPALGVWAIVTVAAIFPWLVVLFGDHRAERLLQAVRRRLNPRGPSEEAPRLDRPLWRTPIAWALTCVFFVNSIIGYTMFAWMPDLLRSAGLSSLAAAHGLALWAIGSLPGALLVPVIVARMKRFLWVLPVVFFAGYVIGFAGLAFSPAHGTVAWIIITRFGDCFFPFSLTLVNLRTKTHEEATAMSGFVQSVGYTIASAGPWTFGALFAATGHWEVSMIGLMAILPIQFVAGLIVSRGTPALGQRDPSYG